MNHRQQAILARDTIDFIRQYADDAEILQYLESLLFSIARIVGDDKAINWDDLAGICDQRYHSINSGDPIELNDELLTAIYNDSLRIINDSSPE